ncbi:alpha/beta hydrolase [Ferruginibacter sp. SUN106]|uniref:alpha/beta hydrolase n=1 Tax=Ferruginibacter sp. SUN106 TaxID=2978348 RepID=UPI003D36B375
MKKFLKYFLRTVLVLFILVNIITAFHAYKFTHFYDAAEAAPQNKAAAILLGINAFKQQNAAADSGNEKVILTTADHLKLEGWYSAAAVAKGTVCLFHGHGGKKSGTNAEAEAFRKLGYNTFQLDFRAHGSSEGNTCTIGYYESEDVKLVYDFVKSKGEKNIVLWGISMGAATITKAINDYQLQPNKIILEMPFGSIVEAAEGRIKMMGLPAEPLARLITFWGGTEHGFWAFNMKPVEFAKKITCPVLLQWGANDPRVSRKEIDDIYSNIYTEKKLVVYDSSAHESLCKKENEKWVSAVEEFLK